jgi:hypothetical protein
MAGVRPRMIHVQMKQKKETEISLSKQKVRALRYLVGRERHKLVDAELGGSASGFAPVRSTCARSRRSPDALDYMWMKKPCLGPLAPVGDNVSASWHGERGPLQAVLHHAAINNGGHPPL